MIEYPRKSSIDFFENSISSHSKVTSFFELQNCFYQINRIKHSSNNLVLTNIYIISIADVYEILSTHQNVNCIITLSSWNHYSGDAKSHCIQNNVGLFKFNELLGA